MNDKRAFRLLQREFTWQDGLYLWQSRIVSALADRYLKSGSGRRFLLRIRKAISQGLPQEHTALRELLIAENEKEPFTEEQLAALPHALTLSTLQLVVQTKDRALRAQAFRDGVRILRAFDRIDFTRLHDTLSVLHRKLMELDLHNYRNLDEHSRAHVCSRVVRYAKRHHLSECKAATMYAKQAPKPDTARRTALALSLFLALGTLFSVGGFLLFGRGAGLLLVLPFFALSATATQALLIKVFSPIPVLSLRPGTISEKNATLVVITALLSGKQADEALFAKLRRYYYRNRQKNVRFGILADLPESTHTTDPKDKEVLARALSCFEALEKECPGHFCLFVRSRVRCATEGNYMGWERKRGAILELCRATRGKKHSFSLCTLSEAELRSFRYLITLDSDTELSMDSVSELVFTMLHPENIPVVQNGIVVSGYGVLQPRMIASMDSAGKTGFTILQTGSAGKDSYGAYRQDFDQNTFGKSGFCGKGILDIDAFLATLDDAFPEERVLSHDLLEGTRLRCGALCQNALTDSVPKTPISFLKRQHRWMRGDLQSLPFSLPHHRNSRQQKVKNPIDLVGKVQILRNLLFLLRPIFCFACTVYALFLPAAQGTALFLLATLHLSIPLALRVLRHFHHANRRFYSRVLHGVQMGLSEMLYGFASLAETACLHLDALLRSLWRMLFSQKHLLEWVTAEHSELGGTNTLVGCLLFFWKSLVLGLLILILAPVGILTVFGFMTLLFPFACYFLSRPLSQKRSATPAERQFLLEHAKNAYGYYETFVTHQSNYLPPDNYQYTPVARLAERTSPTNIAMYLLSTLAARDLGFLDSTGLYERLDRTLESLSRLPKYKGHLYNWYSTKTLEVLGTPYVSTVDSGNLITSLLTLRYGIDDYCSEEPRLAKLISQIDRTIAICDFSFLYNKERHLFCIGYDTVSGTQSENCYDLFMSESRTTSYFCIAKGIVEKKHWQYLSRPLLKHEGHMGMASWSGTAFEYFLPTLFLPTVPNSLCYECLGFAFYEQLCDKSHGIWGRSESGYYAFDRDLNYQYKAFGAHRLALDPDSVKNDVIAPYASILCLEMSLCFPIKNLKRMMQSDLYGPFGFYEAVDYTPARVGGGYGIVRSYMAHHVGMSILAIASAVDGKRFAERFMRDPEMEAASELLCERIPVDAPIRRRLHRRPMPDSLKKRVTPPEDFGKTTSKGLPGAAGLLSDQLSLLATSEGFVKLTAKQYALTYPLCDERSALRGLRLLVQTDGGQIHDVFRCQNRQFGRFEDALVFSSEEKNLQSRAAFTLCCDKPILSLTLELKGEFTNATPMLLSEVILASEKDWQSHPCYTGLFVECVHRAEDNALLFRRRPKSESEAPFYFLVTMEGGGFDFLSRRDEAFGPMYQEEDLQHLYQKPFSNRDGQCILPFFCLRRSSCCPRGKFSCEFLFAAGNDAEELLKQIRSYRKARASTVGALLAPSYKQEIRARLLASGYDRSLVRYEQVILSSILHNTRQTADRLLSTHSELLWRHGVSTDLPMIALYCTQPQLSDSAKRILQGFLKAQKFLALGGFHFDLLIFHRQSDLYGCPEQKAIKQIIFESVGESVLQRKGGVFPICDENTAQACRYLCPIFWTLDENAVFAKLWQAHFSLNRPTPVIDCLQKPRESVLAAKEVLLSLPGGAFLQDGSYRVNKSRCTAPQSYLYCSHQFGTLVTHNSAGVTFFRNASEFSLTERNTDPLLDMNGERLILSENGHLYDLCATAHTVDFTRSCAIYRGSTAMLQYEVRIGCDDKLPVKAILVQLENKTELSIPVSLHYHIKPSLGKSRVIRQKREQDTVFYRSLDRYLQAEEFGMYLSQINLPDKVGAGKRHTCHFLLGVLNYRNDRSYYAAREALSTPKRVEEAFARYGEHYRKPLSKIELHSSSAALDVMFNGYIPYQVLTGRILARTGFYQCAGAYGFRDQLQDCINMIPLCEDLVRLQIIRCAARQYLEGDVQHWWHDSPEGPHGMRTRCSDDLLWLPFALSQYVRQTGKTELLDLRIPYLSSAALNENESERYERPQKTAHRESIRMHCMRAIDLSLSRMGEHSLPLIGNGDWNDGMNKVGKDGKGESVWLAMFLVMVLESFSKHCLSMGEDRERYLSAAAKLRKTLLSTCFERDRFLRGYFHDGSPLGSAANEECRIDLLPQAFSAFLFPDDPKSKLAMESAYRLLFDENARILKLFTPPFDRSLPDPGYIRGYLPGIRENGGQYTHAAMWGSLAFFALGMYDKGYDVLCGSNPAARSLIPSLAGQYRLEPYLLAGDIYAGEHSGRGGWSLYTGSAGWFYTAVLEGMLGYRADRGKISFCPHLPTALDCVSIKYETDGAVQSRTLLRSDNDKAVISLN